jgi:chromosome partitioning protein
MILSLVSQKGGSAKSTLAVSIAWELLARGSKVLLVDTDPQQTVREVGAVAAAANRPAPTIVAMGKDLFRPDQLPRLAKAFDHVIIDTPGRSGDVQSAALLVSDLALIPVGQSAADMWAISTTLEVVQKARDLRLMHGGSELKSALVITRRLPRTALGKALRTTLKDSETPLFTAETSARVAWQECLGAGLGVAQYAPRDAAAKELRSLVDELLSFVSASDSHHLEVANG